MTVTVILFPGFNFKIFAGIVEMDSGSHSDEVGAATGDGSGGNVVAVVVGQHRRCPSQW